MLLKNKNVRNSLVTLLLVIDNRTDLHWRLCRNAHRCRLTRRHMLLDTCVMCCLTHASCNTYIYILLCKRLKHMFHDTSLLHPHALCLKHLLAKQWLPDKGLPKHVLSCKSAYTCSWFKQYLFLSFIHIIYTYSYNIRIGKQVQRTNKNPLRL